VTTVHKTTVFKQLLATSWLKATQGCEPCLQTGKLRQGGSLRLGQSTDPPSLRVGCPSRFSQQTHPWPRSLQQPCPHRQHCCHRPCSPLPWPILPRPPPPVPQQRPGPQPAPHPLRHDPSRFFIFLCFFIMEPVRQCSDTATHAAHWWARRAKQQRANPSTFSSSSPPLRSELRVNLHPAGALHSPGDHTAHLSAAMCRLFCRREAFPPGTAPGINCPVTKLANVNAELGFDVTFSWTAQPQPAAHGGAVRTPP